MLLRPIYLIAVGALAGVLAGCSGTRGGVSEPVSSQTARITVQPLSQTVPLGEQASFAVRATGQGALSYQWMRNGAAIDGAEAASYTTSALEGADNGAAFTVKVTDENGSVTSQAAVLTAGARSPAAGDLRLLLFQQATASGLGTTSESSDLTPNMATLYPGAVGSPLELGSSAVCEAGVTYGCGWKFSVESLPTSQNGLTMFYQGRDYADFGQDLKTISATNVVVHSLDLEPGNRAYAMAWVSTLNGGGFDVRRETVDAGQVDATATADGAASRVITAVSFDKDGKATLLSYGWTGDTTTAFETRTVVTGAENIVTEAKQLADDGYIVSAFGGNDEQGYLLVGTRVEGDNVARVLSVSTGTTSYATSAAKQTAYSTPVIRFKASDGTETVIRQY